MIAGPSSLDLYLKSSARDTDLQVTLSEVRADGNETYVQNGWLRASHRKLSCPAVDRARPVPHAPEEGRREASQAAVRARAGPDLSRWRTRSVPGRGSASRSRRRAAIGRAGPSPRWTRATTNNTIALGGARASSLVLPVVAGANAKGTPLPAPTALRGEPNRAYKTASNGG